MKISRQQRREKARAKEKAIRRTPPPIWQLLLAKVAHLEKRIGLMEALLRQHGIMPPERTDTGIILP